jgi:uncharacterized protein (TIGR04255 family)
MTPDAQLSDYKNPPVGEVACGLIFKPLQNLLIPHFGLFWQEVKESFPNCAHAQRLLEGNLEAFDSLSNFPLPRVWLIGKSEREIIQIQNDRLHFNWRRVEAEDNYPHYSLVIEQYKKFFKIFSKFLENNNLDSIEPVRCELTYFNYLLKGEEWESNLDLRDIFPDLGWRPNSERFLGCFEKFMVEGDFPLKDNTGEIAGRLKVNLKQGTRRIDGLPLIVFELTASTACADKPLEAIWEWFALAHTWIVKGFEDLTGNEIKVKVWKRES